MASDFQLSSGTEPMGNDTVSFLWIKILMQTQDNLGASANPNNDPKRDDPLWVLRTKVDRALNGV